MPKRKKAAPVAFTFTALLMFLGAADAFLLENKLLTSFESLGPPTEQSTDGAPPGAVRKASGPDVLKIASDQGFETKDSKERTLIGQMIPADEATVQQRALLKGNDRAGLIAWVESGSVQTYFLALKEALHASFSPDVRDLIDERQEQPGRPPRHLVSFLDPGLSEERIIFVRIRQRLFELHVAPGTEDEMFELIEELTR